MRTIVSINLAFHCPAVDAKTCRLAGFACLQCAAAITQKLNNDVNTQLILDEDSASNHWASPERIEWAEKFFPIVFAGALCELDMAKIETDFDEFPEDLIPDNLNKL